MFKKTLEQFICDAKEVHGDKYDYSLVDYKDRDTKVKIICPIHGVFEQKPSDHITNKAGCPSCKKEKLANTFRKNKDFFIEEAKKIFPDYDYSEVDYKNNKTKVKLICPIHGAFFKAPSKLLSGQGCKFCSSYKKDTNSFIEEAKKIHGNDYDYSEVEYVRSNSKVIIECNNCGRKFLQTPEHHLEGKGCPYCNFSKGEKEISKLLREHEIIFEEQKTFKDCVYKKNLRFDFYIPSINTVIEYQGTQHYKAVNYFGGENGLKEIIKRDQIKRDFCSKNLINEIEIKYDENLDKIVKDVIISCKEKNNGEKERSS